MKRTPVQFFCFICLFFVSLHVFSLDTVQDRSSYLYAAQIKIAQLESTKQLSYTLGPWNDIIESSLFLLLRTTELHRGSIQVIISDSASYPVRWYPDHTIVISTELLDFIDYYIFEQASLTGRRIRNITLERENLFVPFIAYEISRFALNYPYQTWLVSASDDTLLNFDQRTQETHSDVFVIDEYAKILLSLAGYSSSLYDTWLAQSLQVENFTLFPTFSSWLALQPSSVDRLTSVQTNSEKIKHATSDMQAIHYFIALQTELAEAQELLDRLFEEYPHSIHLMRLRALSLHLKCIDENFASLDMAPRLIPFAQLKSSGYIFSQDQATQLSDTDLFNTSYLAAKDAYELYLTHNPEDTMFASYALFSLYGNRANTEIDSILAIAKKASQSENLEKSKDSFCRYVYSSLLHYVYNEDTIPKQLLLEIANLNVEQKPAEGFLSRGYSMDSSYISATLDSFDLQPTMKDTQSVLSFKNRSIQFRGIALGDSANKVIDTWGEPDSIRYSINLEIWTYSQIGANLLFVPNKTNQRSLFYVQSNLSSILSPSINAQDTTEAFNHLNIRVGENRKLLEIYIGNSSRRSNDCELYTFGDTELLVLYSGNFIKKMSLKGSFF